jgi:DNA-directed RNA polymerase specialized sigma24 family protein
MRVQHSRSTRARQRTLRPRRRTELLAAQDPRRAQVIELRFFGGLSVEETAEALGVSPQTVTRD